MHDDTRKARLSGWAMGMTLLLASATAWTQAPPDLAARLEGTDGRLLRALIDTLSVPPLSGSAAKDRNLHPDRIVLDPRPPLRAHFGLGARQELSRPDALDRTGLLWGSVGAREIATPGFEAMISSLHIEGQLYFLGDLPNEAHGENNLAADVATRLEGSFGEGGFYGVEVGVADRRRFDLTRLQVRPFIGARLELCVLLGGASAWRSLITDDEDAWAWGAEFGFGCVIAPSDVAGLHGQLQFGQGINDDDTAVNVQGLPLPSGATSRDHNRWAATAFYHHRFDSGLGAEVRTQIGRMEDDARRSTFYYDDLWQSYALALEWPMSARWALMVEVDARFGKRQFVAPRPRARVLSFDDDYLYTDVGGSLTLEARF